MKNLIFTVLTLVVCGAQAGSSSTVGPAHPAPLYCVEAGGRTLGNSSPGPNEPALCQLNDGSIVGTMTLYSTQTPIVRRQALDLFIQTEFLTVPKTSNPDKPLEWANDNCLQQGGALRTAHEEARPTIVYSVCQFPDNSAIEVWTLLNGTRQYPKLFTLLTKTLR